MARAARSAHAAAAYLGIAASLGVLFSLLPTLVVLVMWLRTLLAQFTQARLVREKGGSNWKRAFLDPEKGGCGVRFMVLEETMKPGPWRQQRRFAQCLWLLLSLSTIVGLFLVTSAAARAGEGAKLAVAVAEEALDEARRRADVASNATAQLASAYAVSNGRMRCSRTSAGYPPSTSSSPPTPPSSPPWPRWRRNVRELLLVEPVRYKLVLPGETG